MAIESNVDAQPYPTRLFFAVVAKRVLHVVVAYEAAGKVMFVVTAYEPDGKLWEVGFKQRRNSK